jgi:hypothetical protein
MHPEILQRIVSNCDMTSWNPNASRVGIHSPPYHPVDVARWLEDATFEAASNGWGLLQCLINAPWAVGEADAPGDPGEVGVAAPEPTAQDLALAALNQSERRAWREV